MLFRDRYRIPSARWQMWDYTRPAWYFVTVCSKEKECFFGGVVHGQVRLSPMGRIVAEEWQKTVQVRAGIELDEWQVMPNHFHGIIHIVDRPRPTDVDTPRWGVSHKGEVPCRDGPLGRLKNETFRRNVSTGAGTHNSFNHAERWTVSIPPRGKL